MEIHKTQTGLFIYWSTAHPETEQTSNIHSAMVEVQMYPAKWKKPDLKGYMQYGCIYMTFY